MLHTAYNQPGGKGVIIDRSRLANNVCWFVQSTHANASDAAGYGRHPDTPFATLDYLLSNYSTLGVATYDRVVLGPGHNEGLGDDQWTIALAGLTIEAHELAVGGLAPIFDFDHANASIDITASNVVLKGLKFRASVDSCLIGIHVATSVTGCQFIGCEWTEGEAAEDEFVKSLYLQSGNHDTTIRDCIMRTDSTATGATHAIHIAAASHRLTFVGNKIYGTYSTGGLVEAAAGTQHIVIGNSIKTAGTDYSFHGSSTFAARIGGGGGGNETSGVPEDVGGNLIGYNDNDNAVDTSSVVANGAGSVLEREQAIQDYTKQLFSAAAGTGVYPTGVTDDSMWAMLLSKSGTASAASYNNTTDSLEALSDALGAGTGCTAALVAANLDHLAQTADGTDVYPATLATDSILAMIMCKGAAATAATYNNTTDSLEALSDALAAGTGCTTALGTEALDHLMHTADGTGAYPASAADDSVISMVLSKSNPASAASYDNTTDSLEAISDQARKIDLVTMGTVAAGSLASALPRCCEKSDGAVLSGLDPLFTISGGPIKVISITGIVTTVIGGACNMKLQITTTTPAATVDISAGAVAIDTDAEGTSYTTLNATGVFTPTTAGFLNLGLAGAATNETQFFCPAGSIGALGDAARTGNIKWYLHYIPLSPNSLVTAAA